MASQTEIGHRPKITAVFAEELHHRWGLILGLGAVLFVLGLVAIGSSPIATIATVFFFGAVFIAAGITEIVLAFSARGWQGVVSHLVIGVLTVVLGGMFLRAPLLGASTLTLFMASWLLVSGIGQIIHALMERYPQWGWSLVAGFVGALLGVLLFAQWPIGSLVLPGLYFGVTLVVYGASWIALAFAIRKAAKEIGTGPRGGPWRTQTAT